MKAIQLIEGLDIPLSLEEVDRPALKEGQCLVKIKAASLNRRDYWITVGKYPGTKPGSTLGSDGAGVVVEGPEEWVGQEVIINPNINWGDNPVVQSKEYEILGMPQDGTLAEYIALDTDRLIQKPKHLTATQAAAFPLAGLTAFRACFTKGEIKKDQHVLITGIGGGVAQMALSFSLAVSAHVYVTSSGEEKISKAIDLGALDGFNYKEEDWATEAKEESGGFDVIIDSSGGNLVDQYLKIIKPGGKIVIYGASNGRGEHLDLPRLFWSQASLLGTTMGTDAEFFQMIKFIEEYKLVPTIDKQYELKDFRNAFMRFVEKSRCGKIVVKISD